MVRKGREIVSAAAARIGLHEDPRGSNSGRDLAAFLRNTGFEPGQPWCMYFCIAVLKSVYGPLPEGVKDTGSCQLAADYAERYGQLSDYAATGSIFVLPNAKGHFHHAGIVTGVVEPRDKTTGGIERNIAVVNTVEGNTNKDGSREGYGVFRHVRPLTSLRYIVWK